MTAGAALEEAAARLAAAGVPDPRREGRLLLMAAGAPDPLLAPEAPLGPEAPAVARAVARRVLREPFAYIVGQREFYGLSLAVGPGVLVPRPETEGLVARAAALAPTGGCVADICTGSGAVAAALAWARPDLRVAAADISPEALAIAAANVARLGLAGRVRTHLGDLWAALPPGRYALCTCNPPYLDADEWSAAEPEVRQWEPPIALVAPEGWRALYGRLAAGARTRLIPGGHLLVEIGAAQGPEVAAIFTAAGLADVAVMPDLAGRPRYVGGRRP